MFQSPSLRGSGRFLEPERAKRIENQVSIPFIAGQWSLPEAAYTASERDLVVSIPFIAGQWSLPPKEKRMHKEILSFNPLHCGAVVASPRTRNKDRSSPVSIPFIAGQWSLQWRLVLPTGSQYSFNPLHCGAVVASCCVRIIKEQARLVSIPFIAGQWSLPPAHRRSHRASRRFNPLHCGAVVASRKSRVRPEVGPAPVSIPFIAGQWSLLSTVVLFVLRHWVCFNPLHCGAVVASPSHNALPSLRRPAAEFATCLRPPSLGVLAQVA